MTERSPAPGGATALVLVAVVLVAIPAGLAAARGLSVSGAQQQALPTVTPPSLSGTATDTPTSTATATVPQGGNGTTHVVNDAGGDSGGGLGGGSGESGSACSNPDHTSIQAAVDAASSGDTVRVCAGTYPEGVTVTTANLTILGDGTPMILSAGSPAFWTNASAVTIRGFDIQSHQGAAFAVVIGGQNALFRNNTVRVTNGTGIFLSDGRTTDGEPAPALGAATGSRVVGNNVSAKEWRIWADADHTTIRNNRVTDLQYDSDPDRTCDGRECEGANHSIVSSGNGTVIRNNTVRYTTHPPTLYTPVGSGILVSLSAQPGREGNYYSGNVTGAPGRGASHDLARDNRVIHNSVAYAPGGAGAIGVFHGADGTVLRDNTLSKSLIGMVVWSNRTTIRNNTIRQVTDGIRIHGRVTVTQNTVRSGIRISGHAVVIGNTIQNPLGSGITFAERGHVYPANGTGQIIGNKISDNAANGMYISEGADPTQIEIHRNRILNNSDLGIFNANETAFVDARNNIWACGGPSSGGRSTPLEDPVTGRLANGTGDAISAGDEAGVSNVHFDPFFDVSGCPSDNSTVTPSSSPSPTPTPTSAPPGDDDGNTSGPSGGDGTSSTGSSAGRGNGTATGTDSGEEGNQPATQQSTVTATVTATSTVTPTVSPSPTEVPSPTPVVEPGFGIGTWLVGFVLTAGLLVIRRREEDT